MSDFADSIKTEDFLYSGRVFFTSPYTTFKDTIIAKLVLNSDNFNFNLSNIDGSDFRLLDGVNTLRMWLAHWSKSGEHAVLFFKLQNIGAGASVSLKAYWGNSSIESNSEPESMGLLLYENFSGSSISSSKWSGGLSNGSSSYGYLINNTFSSIINPLLGYTSWVLEAGIYGNWDTDGDWDSTDRAIGFGFSGTENNIVINIMHNDRIEYNAVEPGGGIYSFSIKTHGGLEGRSQNDVYISYYEPEDKITFKLENRKNFDNIYHIIQRKVEGDTRPNNILIYPRQTSTGLSGAYPTYISWLIIREYDGLSLGSLDGSELYVEHEYVPHQTQDYRDFGPDITSITYAHESSFGGDPYLLSNDTHNSGNVWISDLGAVSEDYVSVIIHTGWSSSQLVKRSYQHYDSDHVYYYNASKLSDQDFDRMGRDFWQCTTTSGWSAIKFPFSRTIGAFGIKFTDDYASSPKNYTFLGSNFYPKTQIYFAKLLDSGSFDNTTEWQYRKIDVPAKFKYYILNVLDTYGDDPIKLQEWRMFDSLGNKKIYPTQLRLHPATQGDYMNNFPKEIMFEGSLDDVNWVTLIPWTYTYTPYVEHYNGYGFWQRYSFVNNYGFWSFKLSCRGNWGAGDGKIIIGEWSIHELVSETFKCRILGGTTNNIQQIWAQEDTTFEDEHKIFYVANEMLTSIVSDKQTDVKELPTNYDDFNIL